MCYFEQLLEPTTHKTTAVGPLSTYLKDHSSKMNKAKEIQLTKLGQTHSDILLW